MTVLAFAFLLTCCGGSHYDNFPPDDVLEGCTYLRSYGEWLCRNLNCTDFEGEEDCQTWYDDVYDNCREQGDYCVMAYEAAECEQWLLDNKQVDDCSTFPNDCAQSRLSTTCE